VRRGGGALAAHQEVTHDENVKSSFLNVLDSPRIPTDFQFQVPHSPQSPPLPLNMPPPPPHNLARAQTICIPNGFPLHLRLKGCCVAP
jgi:hypothetical protein